MSKWAMEQCNFANSGKKKEKKEMIVSTRGRTKGREDANNSAEKLRNEMDNWGSLENRASTYCTFFQNYTIQCIF